MKEIQDSLYYVTHFSSYVSLLSEDEEGLILCLKLCDFNAISNTDDGQMLKVKDSRSNTFVRIPKLCAEK